MQDLWSSRIMVYKANWDTSWSLQQACNYFEINVAQIYSEHCFEHSSNKPRACRTHVMTEKLCRCFKISCRLSPECCFYQTDLQQLQLTETLSETDNSKTVSLCCYQRNTFILKCIILCWLYIIFWKLVQLQKVSVRPPYEHGWEAEPLLVSNCNAACEMCWWSGNRNKSHSHHLVCRGFKGRWHGLGPCCPC